MCRSWGCGGIRSRRLWLDAHFPWRSLQVSGADPVLLRCHILLHLCDVTSVQHRGAAVLASTRQDGPGTACVCVCVCLCTLTIKCIKWIQPKDFGFLSSHQDSIDRTKPLPLTNGRNGLLAPKLDLIGENETIDSYDLYDPYGDNLSEHGDMDMDFLEMERVRSKFTHSCLLSQGCEYDCSCALRYFAHWIILLILPF